ncbi:MAG: asparaginase [Flavobacteriia bacterium]|nr:asparaginase [Flavobacteriia bacterium]
MIKILLIYTGGTIGMVRGESGELQPFNFDSLLEQVPELKQVPCEIDTFSFEQPVDSSVMKPSHWVQMAEIVRDRYNDYDGFVILHGSDTMAYTSSALSFMLENLRKPVILTGAQLPIGMLRSDARENILTAMEIASARTSEGEPAVPEVAIYFEYTLFRGNRVYKYSSQSFDAYDSPNYPFLAESGVDLQIYHDRILHQDNGQLSVHTNLETNITLLHFYPGLDRDVIEHTLLRGNRKAVILHTFGAGNAPMESWLDDAIREAIANGTQIINVTQCRAGGVDQWKYAAGAHLARLGVISAGDMTLESTLTKAMVLLGEGWEGSEFRIKFEQSLCGERSN